MSNGESKELIINWYVPFQLNYCALPEYFNNNNSSIIWFPGNEELTSLIEKEEYGISNYINLIIESRLNKKLRQLLDETHKVADAPQDIKEQMEERLSALERTSGIMGNWKMVARSNSCDEVTGYPYLKYSLDEDAVIAADASLTAYLFSVGICIFRVSMTLSDRIVSESLPPKLLKEIREIDRALTYGNLLYYPVRNLKLDTNHISQDNVGRLFLSYMAGFSSLANIALNDCLNDMGIAPSRRALYFQKINFIENKPACTKLIFLSLKNGEIEYNNMSDNERRTVSQLLLSSTQQDNKNANNDLTEDLPLEISTICSHPHLNSGSLYICSSTSLVVEDGSPLEESTIFRILEPTVIFTQLLVSTLRRESNWLIEVATYKESRRSFIRSILSLKNKSITEWLSDCKLLILDKYYRTRKKIDTGCLDIELAERNNLLINTLMTSYSEEVNIPWISSDLTAIREELSASTGLQDEKHLYELSYSFVVKKSDDNHQAKQSRYSCISTIMLFLLTYLGTISQINPAIGLKLGADNILATIVEIGLLIIGIVAIVGKGF